jgi:Cu-Zn family superoxide dismutase
MTYGTMSSVVERPLSFRDPISVHLGKLMKKTKAFTALIPLIALLAACATSPSPTTTVTMHAISADGMGKLIGTIRAEDSKEGLLLTAALKGLSPGDHGFHVHENPNCGPKEKDGKPVAGLAAGGHYDPAKTGKHEGPAHHGHLGDLPALSVDANGNANGRITAPRLKLADLKGRSIMIHEGGDNYADSPKPLGGGGGRIACGVTP